MKKILTLTGVLALGLIFQAQAVGVNSNQGGSTPSGSAGQLNAPTTEDDQINQGNQAGQGNQVGQPAGNAVSNGEQNQVMNRGEEGQIQTQEQNSIGAGTNIDGKNSGLDLASQRRSQVANAVKAMFQLAEREGGIGQQVKVIAQNQNQNQVKLEQHMEKIEDRGGLAKFLIGPNYKEIRSAQETLEQNKRQIQELNQIKNQLSNSGDQQQLMEQIKILEDANREIEASLSESQEGFSLFGWLNKLIN